jgi:serine/threonine-protein phosphatase 5
MQKAQKNLPKDQTRTLLAQVTSTLKKLPSLVDVDVPDDITITVCGDVHGQYYDLLNIFEINGLPSTTKPYLFNGDFVDRGSFSVEVILLLFALKVLYPGHVHLARGNHEAATMNKLYGFEQEVLDKYDQVVFNDFMQCFSWLPVVHVINKKVLVVHGGLGSRDDVTLDDIRKIERNTYDDSQQGLMCELLWADPQDEPGRSPSKRGVGLQFGPDCTKRFLDANGLELLIRSHEMKMEGYEVAHGGKCITIFSAPNYCDQMRNLGAFIHLLGRDMKPEFRSFAYVPHPQVNSYMRLGPMGMMGMGGNFSFDLLQRLGMGP